MDQQMFGKLLKFSQKNCSLPHLFLFLPQIQTNTFKQVKKSEDGVCKSGLDYWFKPLKTGFHKKACKRNAKKEGKQNCKRKTEENNP